MSYDVSLTIDTGRTYIDGNGEHKPDPVGVWDRNMTSNVGPMWRHAGADLADMHGWPAAKVEMACALAIRRMEGDPATYRAMNPANGWGDYEGCLQFLRDIRDACAQHPKTTFEVHR